MEKILFLTDLHLTNGDAPIIGISPKARLNATLNHATTHHADAVHMFIMGDLAHHGHENAYKALQNTLENVEIPFTLMLGNHDRRTPFAQVFGDTGFQHGCRHLCGIDFIYLDTLDEDAPDGHSGILCPNRLAWLRDTLGANAGPAIILMHHHLTPTGFDGMDGIALRNAAQVIDIILASRRLVHIINGHIHRDITTQIGPIPLSMIKSTCHQMPLALGAGSSGLSVDEPGGYGIGIIQNGRFILHRQDVGLPQNPMIDEPASL